MSSFEDLGQVLHRNPREEWASILADYFKCDISLVETLVDAYFELSPDGFSSVISSASNAKDDFYTTYLNGEIVKPTDEDVEYAYQVEKRVLEQLEGGKPQINNLVE